ncbi:MAG: hypothetical protein ACD_12C00439G0008 [uncultured bacterium]|nr:MAG: hypothetical protein ACD_12C00439G0008 [uncultured bacterium]
MLINETQVKKIYGSKGDAVTYYGPVDGYEKGLILAATGINGCKLETGNMVDLYLAENGYTMLGILGQACGTCQFAELPKKEGGCQICFRT